MYKTSYYDDFKCIGSECPNSCCVGWEIDLDINTFQKYKQISESLKYLSDLERLST